MDRIKSGKLQYCKEIGWINWGHANPENTINSFNQLQFLNKNASDSFLFNYSQKMKFKIADRYFVAEYIESRKIKPYLTVSEEKQVFLDIFLSVTESFETMQSQFPYLLIPDSRKSSFRDGDLTGNLISFYIATNNTNISEVKNKLTLFDAGESLKKFNGLSKKDWNSITLVVEQTNNVLDGLNAILEQSKIIHEPLSRKIYQKDTSYYQK